MWRKLLVHEVHGCRGERPEQQHPLGVRARQAQPEQREHRERGDREKQRKRGEQRVLGALRGQLPGRVRPGEDLQVEQRCEGGHRGHEERDMPAPRRTEDRQPDQDEQERRALRRVQPRRQHARTGREQGGAREDRPAWVLPGPREQALQTEQEHGHQRDGDGRVIGPPRGARDAHVARADQEVHPAPRVVLVQLGGEPERRREVEDRQHERRDPLRRRVGEPAARVRRDGEHDHDDRHRPPEQVDPLDVQPGVEKKARQEVHRLQEVVVGRLHAKQVRAQHVIAGVADPGLVLKLVVRVRPDRAGEDPARGPARLEQGDERDGRPDGESRDHDQLRDASGQEPLHIRPPLRAVGERLRHGRTLAPAAGRGVAPA